MLLLRLLLLAVMKLDVILIYVMKCGFKDIDVETIQMESVANTLSNRQFPSPQHLGFDSRSNLFFFSDSFSTAY